MNLVITEVAIGLAIVVDTVGALVYAFIVNGKDESGQD